MDETEGWILAGQSNMEGYGLLADTLRESRTDDRLTSLSSGGQWEVARDPLQRLWESYTPAHAILQRPGLPGALQDLSNDELAARDREGRVSGAGLGPSFGLERVRQTGGEVALVPAAHGGTSLEHWWPGWSNFPRESTDTLYGALLDRVRRAEQRADFRLRGMLWFQGESDTQPSRAATYATRFDSWLGMLRHDLDAPRLEVVVVQLGRLIRGDLLEHHTASAWSAIREAQRTLPHRDRLAGVVSAVDLTMTDEIHLDAPGLARLGRRLATAVDRGLRAPDVTRVEAVGTTPNDFVRLRVVTTDVSGGWQSGAIPGFSITDGAGSIRPDRYVVDAHRDPEDHTAIEVLVGPASTPLRADDFLAYGLGFAPTCTAVDQADQALPCFAPLPIIGLR